MTKTVTAVFEEVDSRQPFQIGGGAPVGTGLTVVAPLQLKEFSPECWVRGFPRLKTVSSVVGMKLHVVLKIVVLALI